MGRKYDQAIEQFIKTLELDANYARTHEWLADTYELKGMQKETVAAWSAALSATHEEELARILEKAYVSSGFDAAKHALWQKKLEKLHQRAAREYVLPMDFAEAYFRLGQTEQALMWLEKACEERSGDVLVVKVDPFFESLRSHPRFDEIVRCLGQ
ncbi:MAG TPA: hypothetical protein VJ180_13965 [Pyrinomonadaceae bacterium]|nr:hypothetical protein [Pyrinomonadaceae bacterium]